MNQIIGFVVNSFSAWADLFNGRFAIDKLPYLLGIIPIFFLKGIILKLVWVILKCLFKLLTTRTRKKKKAVDRESA